MSPPFLCLRLFDTGAGLLKSTLNEDTFTSPHNVNNIFRCLEQAASCAHQCHTHPLQNVLVESSACVQCNRGITLRICMIRRYGLPDRRLFFAFRAQSLLQGFVFTPTSWLGFRPVPRCTLLEQNINVQRRQSHDAPHRAAMPRRSRPMLHGKLRDQPVANWCWPSLIRSPQPANVSRQAKTRTSLVVWSPYHPLFL